MTPQRKIKSDAPDDAVEMSGNRRPVADKEAGFTVGEYRTMHTSLHDDDFAKVVEGLNIANEGDDAQEVDEPIGDVFAGTSEGTEIAPSTVPTLHKHTPHFNP